MLYEKSSNVFGKWVKGSEIQSGISGKLVSETEPKPSQFKNKDGSTKMQNVAKIQIEGGSEPLNISINNASINALIDAFGKESGKWQGNNLTIETEKVRVGGKAVVAVYLIPAGYEKRDDSNGYAVIGKIGEEVGELPEVDLDEPNF